MHGRSYVFLLCTLMLAAGCGRSAPEGLDGDDEPVVATVGGEPIYARDFVRNYELGFPHLRRGANARRAYLDRVIDEKLMALEGYRRGLGEHEAIKRRIDDLREELLVEQVFHRYVNDRIQVTEGDIISAMQRDRVSFRLRYLPAPSLARAQRLRDQVQSRGFDETIRAFVAAQDASQLSPADLESPYVTHQDLHPDLMKAIADLPLGEISAPVPYNGSYLLLQVLDVRREPIAPASVADRSRYEQIVFQQKAKAKARDFIGSMMEPLDVRVKPTPYTLLRDNLWRWYQDDPPQQNLLRTLRATDAAYGDRLRSVLDDVLISTSEADWTVRDFLREFPVERYPLRYRRTEDFENDLYDAIGLTLRDHHFVRRAIDEDLDDEAVHHQLLLWTDKWVYRALRDTLADGSETVGETLRRLRDRYEVVIHHDVLDTLDLSAPQHAGLTVLKGHTMRPAFPIVDPAW